MAPDKHRDCHLCRDHETVVQDCNVGYRRDWQRLRGHKDSHSHSELFHLQHQLHTTGTLRLPKVLESSGDEAYDGNNSLERDQADVEACFACPRCDYRQQ
jgi:hypothetical protein